MTSGHGLPGQNKLARVGRHDDGSNTSMCTVETFSGRRTFRGNGKIYHIC